MNTIHIVTLGSSSAGIILVLVIAGYLLLTQFLIRAIARAVRRNGEQTVLQIGISPFELARLRATSAPADPPPWIEPSIVWREVTPTPFLARPTIRIAA